MQSHSLSSVGEVCCHCQWRLIFRTRRHVHPITFNHVALSLSSPQLRRRAYHATRRHLQASPLPTNVASSVDSKSPQAPIERTLPIRQYLEQWQELYGGPSEDTLVKFENHPALGDTLNSVSRLSSIIRTDDEYSEEHDDDQGVGSDDGLTIKHSLKPGDVVEFPRVGHEPELAVFVQRMEFDNQFYTVGGRWVTSALGRIDFVIPGCIDPSLVTPIVPYLPTVPTPNLDSKGEIHVPQEIGLPVQRILERLTEDADSIYRQNSPILDGAYSKLADIDRPRVMTLAQITKALLAPEPSDFKPSPAALLAVRKALLHRPLHFRTDARSCRDNGDITIRPQNEIQNIDTVHQWIRAYQDYRANMANPLNRLPRDRNRSATYIADFISKARRLIAKSREYRDPNPGILGPSKVRHPTKPVEWGEEFTNTDRQIIGFMETYVLLAGPHERMDEYRAACTILIQATECYPQSIQNNPKTIGHRHQAVTRGVGNLFLSEIGVLSPYENRCLYQQVLMLPTLRYSRKVETLVNKAESMPKNPQFHDSMAHLRHDWGNTTVYCIDGAEAKEIDDGISVSKVDGTDSEHWIHVHIANPTAFFNKTHAVAALAAHRVETVYVPERTFPMMPNWVSQDHFSLESNRPVITFSSRVDFRGRVLERKIGHGIIRNVIRMTPNDLSKALGEKSQIQITKLVVGGQVRPPAMDRTREALSPDQVKDLQTLYSVARGLFERRKVSGNLDVAFQESASVRLFGNEYASGLEWTAPSLLRSRLILTDPVIELSFSSPRKAFMVGMDATDIVAEIMILANQSAAMWCEERGIPVIFRGTIMATSQIKADSERFRKETLIPYLEKHGTLTPYLVSLSFRHMGQAVPHTAPIPHQNLGISAYARVTSPLRRYTDMIAHWQIEAAILHESRAGRRFHAAEVGSTSPPILPFTVSQLQEQIFGIHPKEFAIRRMQRDSTRFWILQAMMRAFHYGEAELPKTFRVWIRVTGDRRGQDIAIGQIVDYAFSVRVLPVTSMNMNINVEEGDEWEAELHSFDAFNMDVFVIPLRLIRRETF